MKKNLILITIGLFFILIGMLPAFGYSSYTFSQPDWVFSGIRPPGGPLETGGLGAFAAIVVGFLLQSLGALLLLSPAIDAEPKALWPLLLGFGLASTASFSGIFYSFYQYVFVYHRGNWGYSFMILPFFPSIICFVCGFRMLFTHRRS
jgi:hypothetical protein